MSACLLGRECRHDGRSSVDSGLVRALAEGGIIPVCPEVLGGLGIPRAPAEIRGGAGAEVLDGAARVLDVNGEDVTEAFVQGARKALEEGRRRGARFAYLKSRSPSCGIGRILQGGETRAGNGVFAEMCKREGLEVVPCEGRSGRLQPPVPPA